MDKSLLIQKQIKDNAEDLQKYVRDLKLWEEEMKRKDRQLSNGKTEEPLPPVRRPKFSNKDAESPAKKEECKKKKLASYDYNSWDKFDVEKACEEIDREDNGSENTEVSNEEIAAQEDKYLKEKALYEKELGNKHVKASKWDEAIECYTKAIKAYPKDPVFFANRALCYLKKKKYEMVESDCTSSLKLDPTYVKAMLRRAAAREALDRIEDACYDLRNALKLEPNNNQALKDLERIKQMSGKKKNTTVNSKETISKMAKETTEQNIVIQEKCKTISTPQFVNENNKQQNLQNKSTGGSVVEPDWEPCNNTIQPIFKAPHMRSKKCLKRIEIYDIGPNTPQHVCARKLPKSQNDFSTVIQNPTSPTTSTREMESGKASASTLTTSRDVESSIASGPTVKTSRDVEFDKASGSTITTSRDVVSGVPSGSAVKPRSILTVATPVKDVPAPPSNSVQFHNAWSSIKADPQLCYRFLKQISGENLSDIFKESLESRMFSSIIETLASEFTSMNEPVLGYLKGMTRVKRFSTLTLFMSTSDKSNLTKLFDHCLSKGECSSEEISELRRLYEMS